MKITSRGAAFEQLKILQRLRSASIRQSLREQNAARSMVRNWLGYNPTLSEKERCRIKAEAARVVKLVKKGEQTELPAGESEFVRICLVAEGTQAELRKRHELTMRELVDTLPEARFTDGLRGVGLLGLAMILGTSGDPRKYKRPKLLWRRFGIGHYGEQRQRKVTDKDLAEQLGYSPPRRSVLHNIGDALVKQNKNGYRSMYDARKEFENQKTEGAPGKKMSKLWAHRRAMRVMEKRLLIDLWKFSTAK